MASSYRELEARKNRSKQSEKIYMDMALQEELQMRLIVHRENQYSSGVQNESGERNDAVKEVKFFQLDCRPSLAV
ncbi:hypothetical protein NC652_015438 [Populus alba x Populus x berolinensis]|nr:hypothetical protein NC652_015227 [Populus alba x Populus x berolinensis]KAJ6921519.1 hypothetical protein NC652_015438 [Populus alba x Populus x berolinensis]